MHTKEGSELFHHWNRFITGTVFALLPWTLVSPRHRFHAFWNRPRSSRFDEEDCGTLLSGTIKSFETTESIRIHRTCSPFSFLTISHDDACVQPLCIGACSVVVELIFVIGFVEELKMIRTGWKMKSITTERILCNTYR